jgi:RNA polymerase sigma factor (sigma-70 family)
MKPRPAMSMPAPPPEPPPPGEPELLRGALGGDGACWSLLVARHNHRVVVSLLARGVPIDRAKDLAQETWMRLIENQRKGRLLALNLPGLAIVQAGFLLATARRQEGGVAPCSPVRLDEPACEVPAPDEQLINRQELHRVAAALDGLSPAARRVFQFVYEHPELSYAEAALQLQLSTQRVKQTVCEVRKRLRAVLTDEAS